MSLVHADGAFHEESFREDVASLQHDTQLQSEIAEDSTAHIMWAEQESRFESNSGSCEAQDCEQLSAEVFACSAPSPSEGAQNSPSQTRRIMFSQSTVEATARRPVAQAHARAGATVAALGLTHAESFGQCGQEAVEVEHGTGSKAVAEGCLLGGVGSGAEHKSSVLALWPPGTGCRRSGPQSPARSRHSLSPTGDPLSLPWPPQHG